MRWRSWVVAALLLTGFCLADSSSSRAQTAGDERGPITFATGRDSEGKLQAVLDRWNDAHPGEKVTMLELSLSADEQRAAVDQKLRAHSDQMDVVNADVVWVADFASHKWLEPLDEARFAGSGIFAASADTGRYAGQLYGAAYTTNVGMLFYRTDLVAKPPANWAELEYLCHSVAEIADIGCYAGQFAQYEGLTVNLLELIGPGAGADLRTALGSPRARAGLGFLVAGLKDGWIPREAVSFKEEDGRKAFQAGKLVFLRNWSYVFPLANTPGPDTQVAGKIAIAPLPGPDGPTASILGGSDLILSRYSKHKATAKDWMAYMQSEATQRTVLTVMSQMPVLSALYDDPDLQRQSPILGMLKQLVENAANRPKLPYYNAVTLAIDKEATAALEGAKTVQQALSDLTAELKQAAARE